MSSRVVLGIFSFVFSLSSLYLETHCFAFAARANFLNRNGYIARLSFLCPKPTMSSTMNPPTPSRAAHLEFVKIVFFGTPIMNLEFERIAGPKHNQENIPLVCVMFGGLTSSNISSLFFIESRTLLGDDILRDQTLTRNPNIVLNSGLLMRWT